MFSQSAQHGETVILLHQHRQRGEICHFAFWQKTCSSANVEQAINDFYTNKLDLGGLEDWENERSKFHRVERHIEPVA